MLVMILMILVYLCPKLLKAGAKCCSGINSVMAATSVFQRIIEQVTISSKDHVRYVRKNIQLAYMDSNRRKKGQNKTVEVMTISRSQPHAQVVKR